MKYTKGEWGTQGLGLIITDEQGRIISDARLHESLPPLFKDNYSIPAKELQGNVQLMKSAPDMYESLKAQDDFIVSIINTAETLDEITKRVILMHIYSIKELRDKAIAKTEGKNGR
jgi:galactitol-specific phosphotransferase system IIB component